MGTRTGSKLGTSNIGDLEDGLEEDLVAKDRLAEKQGIYISRQFEMGSHPVQVVPE